jgi:aryl-alcohol dehydrogenase-like predicted oxidoreductase
MIDGCSRRRFLGLVAGLSMSGLVRAAGEAPDPAGTACKLIRRTIPKTPETLPVIGLGTWQGLDVANLETARTIIQRFLERGGELIDSAPMYTGAERAIGEIMRQLGVRDRLFLATKVLSTGREAGRSQMRQSFEDLGIERLDLLQVHNLVDWQTQLRTLRELRSAGTVRYIGVTHYRVDAHAALEERVREEDIDFVQVNYNIAVRNADDRLLPLAADRGVAVIVNRPFEEGALFGRVRGKALPDWAAEIDCNSFAQIFLKFIVSHPAVTCVIPGTDKVDHLDDNLSAGCGRLPDAAMRKRMASWFEKL